LSIPVFSRTTKLRRSLRYRDFLCNEHRSSGFLLQNESNYNWPVACMWTGGEMNATCGLIPPTEKPFGFLEPREWQMKLFVCS
uniref:Leishmanolysin-like peptidase n=1 Tax=Gongylonema pulchrum TaxID=637853 RepID=A0A183F180_9BILA